MKTKSNFKYLTDAEYCRAKNSSGNQPLFKVIPIEDRVLFPFHYFTNFSTSVVRGGLNKSFRHKSIENLRCAWCNEDLGEWGNGSFYTAYIVFDSANEFYSCCPDCKPHESLEYFDQIHGFRTRIELPEKYQSSKIHEFIYSDFIYHQGFELQKYPNGISLDHYQKTFDKFKSTWGWASDGLSGSMERGKYVIQDMRDNWKTIYSLPKKKVIEIINDIIKEYFATAKTQNTKKSETKLESIQLTLF